MYHQPDTLRVLAHDRQRQRMAQADANTRRRRRFNRRR